MLYITSSREDNLTSKHIITDRLARVGCKTSKQRRLIKRGQLCILTINTIIIMTIYINTIIYKLCDIMDGDGDGRGATSLSDRLRCARHYKWSTK